MTCATIGADEESVAVEPMVGISSAKKKSSGQKRPGPAISAFGPCHGAPHESGIRRCGTGGHHWIDSCRRPLRRQQRAAIMDHPVSVPLHVAKASFAKLKLSENCLAGEQALTSSSPSAYGCRS